jgi:hypothetical protein
MTIPTDDFVLPASGKILRPFPFRYEFPVTEGFEFLTDIITAADGSEQRIAARDPLRSRLLITCHVIALERDEYQHLQALLFGWNTFLYGVPLWMHATQLAADVVAGDVDLPVDDASGRDLDARLAAEDDVPVLVWRRHDEWEPALLSARASNTLTIRDGLTRDWPAGTFVIPLMTMYCQDAVSIKRQARGIAEVDLEFVQGGTPLSPNQSCAHAPGADDGLARVLMVRPSESGAGQFAVGSLEAHDANNLPAGMPRPPAAADLFGYSRGILLSGTHVELFPGRMAAGGVGTGFSRCTSQAPGRFKQVLAIRGLDQIGVAGAVGSVQASGTEIWPPGMPATDGCFNVGGAFTGGGYAPAAATGTPTVRTGNWIGATLMAGYGERTVNEVGDIVVSYGRYDAGAPGGIAGYEVFPNADANGYYFKFDHGFCIRCKGIAAWKALKIVTEEDLGGGSFGTPVVTTHAFDSGDYADDLIGPVWVTAICGGSTLFGQVHGPARAGGALAHGYEGACDGENFRVTTYLIAPDDREHLQWQDIFRTMWVDAEVLHT